MKRKTNPRFRPVEAGELDRARGKVHTESLDRAWAVFFTVLRDKEGFGDKRLRRVWDAVTRISQDVECGNRDKETMADALFEKTGIRLMRFPFFLETEVRTQGELRRECNKLRRVYREGCWTIFLTALRESEGYGPDRLRRVWGHAQRLEDSIDRRFVRVSDLAVELETGGNVELAR